MNQKDFKREYGIFNNIREKLICNEENHYKKAIGRLLGKNKCIFVPMQYNKFIYKIVRHCCFQAFSFIC